MATVTASAAGSGVQPSAHIGQNSARDTIVLATGQADPIWLTKIPINAQNVQVVGQTIQGGTGPALVLDIGIRQGNGTSITASAMGSFSLGVFVSKAYTPTTDEAASEQFKYVVASIASGTVSASVTVNFAVTWDFNNQY